MSMITPPVALCAFTAAALTGASAMTTAVKSMKFAWTAFIIPFVFVFGPGLLMIGDVGTILIAIATAAFGVYLISVSVAGFFSRPLNIVTRLLLVAAGLAALSPAGATPMGSVIDMAGVALGVLVLGREYFVGRRLASGAAQ